MTIQLEWILPLEIITPNRQEHWTVKHKRNKRNFKIIKLMWNKKKPVVSLPCIIELTRISPRCLDFDNLVFSFKFVNDTICGLIIPNLQPGRADGDIRITTTYKQEKSLNGQKLTRVCIRNFE